MKKNLGIVFLLSLCFVFLKNDVSFGNELDTIYDDGTEKEYINFENASFLSELPSYEGDKLLKENSIIPDIPEGTEYISDSTDTELIAIEPNSIIGTDNRKIITDTTVDPYRKIAFLVIKYPNGKTYIGSGNLISADMVLTAGHCIYSKENGGWAQSIAVYPGNNGDYAPYGVAYSKRLMSVKGWTDNESSEYDIGAVKLDRNIGSSVGWFGLTTAMEGSITLSGYHGDLNRRMATETGVISDHTGNNVFYKLDSTGGSSGSGVYNSKQQILAVHAYGSSNLNFGTKINNANFQLVRDWINYDNLYADIKVGSKIKIKNSATLFCGGKITIPATYKGDKLFEVTEGAWAGTWVNAGSNRRAFKLKGLDLWVFENDIDTNTSGGKETYWGSIYQSLAVGDVVKFETKASNYHGGLVIDPKLKNDSYTIVETKRINLSSGSLRAYRVQGLGNNWILEQDVYKVASVPTYNGSIFPYREIGTSVTLRENASNFYEGGTITADMKSRNYKITQAKWLPSIQYYSWRAYELDGLKGKWVLEHDLLIK